MLSKIPHFELLNHDLYILLRGVVTKLFYFLKRKHAQWLVSCNPLVIRDSPIFLLLKKEKYLEGFVFVDDPTGTKWGVDALPF